MSPFRGSSDVVSESLIESITVFINRRQFFPLSRPELVVAASELLTLEIAQVARAAVSFGLAPAAGQVVIRC